MWCSAPEASHPNSTHGASRGSRGIRSGRSPRRGRTNTCVLHLPDAAVWAARSGASALGVRRSPELASRRSGLTGRGLEAPGGLRLDGPLRGLKSMGNLVTVHAIQLSCCPEPNEAVARRLRRRRPSDTVRASSSCSPRTVVRRQCVRRTIAVPSVVCAQRPRSARGIVRNEMDTSSSQIRKTACRSAS